MKKILYSSLIILFTLAASQQVMAVALNTTFSLGSTCAASGTMMTADGDCKSTPTEYSIKIYEMGFCSSYPYSTAKTSEAIDKSSCVATYTDTSPSTVNIADVIGGKLTLPGVSSAPTEGTYTYPYMIMGHAFTISGQFTNSSTTYYSTSSGGVSTTASDLATITDNLTNFGAPNKCYSGFIGASVTGGTLDAFVANSGLTRGTETDVSSGECTKSGRIVGVMTLTTPVTVTSDTYAVIFNFIMTDYGVQWNDDAGSNSVPDAFGSGPFSGYFTVLSN